MHVSHVILRVADLERSIEFYRDRAGFSILGATESFAFLDGGSIRIALNVRPNQPVDNSLSEIVLEVDDIAAEYEAMRTRGVPFEVQPREVMTDGDRALHAAHFADPDGHLWSITGWVAE
ncbi:MAG: VOC family protein [Acidimicrobiia bacterium]|nr:VOC family protein [Acidimicrobiia bacterium]